MYIVLKNQDQEYYDCFISDLQPKTVTAYCSVVMQFTGSIPSKEEAIRCLEEYEAGNGGNTVGYDYINRVGSIGDIEHEEYTVIGDAMIELGRLLRDS